MKLRLLLTSILFLFAQIPTMQAQETLDFAKITCDQFVLEQLATPSRDIVMWLSGDTTTACTRATRSSNPKHSNRMSTRFIHIAPDTAIRPSWLPSRA
ncbi:MAG TPA: hypothetical protein VER26_08240 [Xanthobacteraceae bacterium]|nr:hypothetical protein [Xanthobacteraceae bacterium]